MNKKVLSIFMAFIMLFSILVPNMVSAENGTNSVTVHKLILSKEDLTNWETTYKEQLKKYDGSQNPEAFKTLLGLNDKYKEAEGVTFIMIYKGENSGSFMKDQFVKNDGTGTTDQPAQAMKVKTTKSGATFNTSKLIPGNYEIQELYNESDYISENGEILADAKAVPVLLTLPIVSEDGTEITDAHVYPKNTVEKPTVDKDFQNGFGNSNGANPNEDRNEDNSNTSVSIGDAVPYEIKANFPAHSHLGTVKFTDTMTSGLTFANDITVEGDLTKDDLEINANLSGFTATIKESGLNKINNQDTDKVITIKYHALVNSAAVVKIPEKNDLRMQYSNKPNKFITPEPPTPITPSDGKIVVKKTWETGISDPKPEIWFDLWEGEGINAKVVSSKKLEGTEIEFNGLDNAKQYRVIERVSGFIAEYSNAGNIVTVNNKKDPEAPPVPVRPQSPGIVINSKKFVKATTGQTERLTDARFVIRDSNSTNAKYLVLKDNITMKNDTSKYEEAQKAYLDALKDLESKLNANPKVEEQITAAQKVVSEKLLARDKAFKESRSGYEFKTVDKFNAEENTDKVIILASDDKGRFEIEGLKDGTYYLEEIKAPEKFAINKEKVEFKVGAGTVDNIKFNPEDAQNNAMFIENKKITIPQTGGIGTVIFTVTGLLIMATAVTSLRKRNEK